MDLEEFEVVSERYALTGEPVLDGDHILLDGHHAVVVRVVLPGTDDAALFGDNVSGGLFVREGAGLVFYPFGHAQVVRKCPGGLT
jgi:hypothetical protein